MKFFTRIKIFYETVSLKEKLSESEGNREHQVFSYIVSSSGPLFIKNSFLNL